MTIDKVLEKVALANTSTGFVTGLDDKLEGDPTLTQMKSFLSHAKRCCTGKGGAQPQKIAALGEVFEILFAPHSPVFKHLNANMVAYQLTIRILEPRRMDQQQFGLCGPSHFALLLAKTKPVTYARIANHLFRLGQCNVDGWKIEPSRLITDYDPAGKIPQADWLVAASIRNSQRQVPLNPSDCGHYENTLPPSMYSWLVSAGYRNVLGLMCSQPSYAMFDNVARSVNMMQTEFFYPDRNLGIDPLPPSVRDPMENIRLACRLSQDGWKLLMMIYGDWAKLTSDQFKSNMTPEMQEQNPGLVERAKKRQIEEKTKSLVEELNSYGFLGHKLLTPQANHWIFVKKIVIDGENIVMTRYTWGDKKTTLPFPTASFVKGYSGFFAVKL